MTARASSEPVAVYLERGRQHVLACAVEWPGWCRYGRSQESALEALASCAQRYALLAEKADIPFPCDGEPAFAVTERLAGSATADFGAPGLIPACDGEPVDAATARRHATLLTAAWAAFYQVSGGRNTSRLVDHVISADVASARRLGIRCRQPSMRDAAGIVALREGITAVIGRPSDGRPVVRKGWPARYAARQIAWHVIDHMWQMQDHGPADQIHGLRQSAAVS
jgi:hypothetical protein